MSKFLKTEPILIVAREIKPSVNEVFPWQIDTIGDLWEGEGQGTEQYGETASSPLGIPNLRDKLEALAATSTKMAKQTRVRFGERTRRATDSSVHGCPHRLFFWSSRPVDGCARSCFFLRRNAVFRRSSGDTAQLAWFASVRVLYSGVD